MTDRPNHIQVEYQVLSALSPWLYFSEVSKPYGDTIYSVPLANGTERANIRVDIVKMVFCSECKSEIVMPSYNQKEHDICHNAKSDSVVLTN